MTSEPFVSTDLTVYTQSVTTESFNSSYERKVFVRVQLLIRGQHFMTRCLEDNNADIEKSDSKTS